jgi:hypothetical protein
MFSYLSCIQCIAKQTIQSKIQVLHSPYQLLLKYIEVFEPVMKMSFSKYWIYSSNAFRNKGQELTQFIPGGMSGTIEVIVHCTCIRKHILVVIGLVLTLLHVGYFSCWMLLRR